jgi:hypothetical protein
MKFMPWKTVFDSVCGTSHVSGCLPCQDACRVYVVQSAEAENLIIVCADGAGSAKHSDVGSLLACDTLLDILKDWIGFGGDVCSLDRDHVDSWLQSVRNELFKRAKALDVPVRELATTLIAGIVTQDAAFFFQIGDGAAVVRLGNDFECVFWPQSGEYANTTNFLTDLEYKKSVEVRLIEQRVEECAVFTDGLERLILNFKEHRVHKPFLEPMFQSLRASNEQVDFFELLRQFLNSQKVNDRTDDDKTLILATRLTHVDKVL